MLKITIIHEARLATLKLEGKLAEDWVVELKTAWAKAEARPTDAGCWSTSPASPSWTIAAASCFRGCMPAGPGWPEPAP